MQETQVGFLNELDHQTDALERALPAGGSSFGAARKAINLFLADAYYHQFVCRHYGLDQIAPFLEVPLDAMVADFLITEAKIARRRLPAWEGIKYLKPDRSREYQAFAADYVAGKGDGWLRVDIDVVARRR